MIALAFDDAHRAILAALCGRCAVPGFKFLEIGQAVGIGPALEAEVFPSVIVLRVAAHPDHAIDRRTSAKTTATGLTQAAVVQMRFRLACVAPIVNLAFNGKGQSCWHADGQRIGHRASLEQAHSHIFLRRETVRQNTTRRASADNHIVISWPCQTMPVTLVALRKLPATKPRASANGICSNWMKIASIKGFSGSATSG